MLLISGRFGLVLVLFAVFLSYGRTRFEALATLPAEALQITSLLAIYGSAALTVAVIVRGLLTVWRFFTRDDAAA